MEMDDHANLERILQEYDTDNKQIRNGCYYFINQTQLFRVKHVLAYLEANRQVSYFRSIFIYYPSFSRLQH